jgi:hypothetical protein
VFEDAGLQVQAGAHGFLALLPSSGTLACARVCMWTCVHTQVLTSALILPSWSQNMPLLLGYCQQILYDSQGVRRCVQGTRTASMAEKVLLFDWLFLRVCPVEW